MAPTKVLRRGALTAVASLVAVGGLVACSPDSQGGAGDAPIAAVETEPWTILNNVDGFPNIATRCRGTTGIYVTRSAGDNSDTLEVVANDPACTVAATGTTLPR